MNWKKIRRYWDYFIWTFMILMSLALFTLTIIGGIQSGDLTWVGIPIWLWNNPYITYAIIGVLSSGAIASAALAWFSKQPHDDDGNAAAAVFFMLFLGAVLWPMLWGFLAIDYYKDRKKKEIEK